jgi:4-amino-4-deoxy-L-arabinose transferase-like glycosyltransferase
LKSITPSASQRRQQWGLLLLTICTFFILLGSRGLNEPDEGRYTEIAREMVETGDWLVPHLWYLPHIDKPPMTYWLVAVSLKVFGQNEWAARLPLALAGLSGVWAVGCLAGSIGGRRVGFWSVLILQTCLLYFGMARMLTTDIFLTQFNAWVIYFFWRSWLSLRDSNGGKSLKSFWAWHLAAWVAIGLGFLTKGPVALAIPLAALASLVIFRWRTFSRKRVMAGGLCVGLGLFFMVAAPWFLAVNVRIPGALNYMLFHQAAGHITGASIKGRHGPLLYFFPILAAGLLPWTWLLGWLWRRAHWRKLPERHKDGWLMLNTWAIFTFTLFSLTHSKLPAYILPLFPALAALLAVRFFGETPEPEIPAAPRWIWSACAVTPLFLLIAFPLFLPRVFRVTLPHWMIWQAPVVAVGAVAIFMLARNWNVSRRAGVAVAAAMVSMLILAREASWFETDLKFNQTLKAFGVLLQKNYHAGDAVLCWGQLPEGLPFYSGGVISRTNRPYLGDMKLTRLPLEFPGNQQRLGALLLPNEAAIREMLAEDRRVLVVIWEERLRNVQGSLPLKEIGHSGQWKLLSNR